MSYQTFFDNAQIIKINGKITIPTAYKGKTNFIIPDSIVKFCTDYYGLIGEGIKVLDPMCGIGTIPRVINAMGGECTGIEIDEQRYVSALEKGDINKLYFDNFLTMKLPVQNFHRIFTSMPFDWFKQIDTSVSSAYAAKFKQCLTKDGFILLDSVPSVSREGQEWPVALRQSDYLQQNGFTLIEIKRFLTDSNSEDANESVIMKFRLS